MGQKKAARGKTARGKLHQANPLAVTLGIDASWNGRAGWAGVDPRRDHFLRANGLVKPLNYRRQFGGV